MESDTSNPTDKTKLANSILKEILGITNVESLWTRECSVPSENKTTVKYSKKSEEHPESEIYFKITVAEDTVSPHCNKPGGMELCAGISNDCVNLSIWEKAKQRLGKKLCSQELDAILSYPETQEVLSNYELKPHPYEHIKKSNGGKTIIYLATLTDDQTTNYLIAGAKKVI